MFIKVIDCMNIYREWKMVFIWLSHKGFELRMNMVLKSLKEVLNCNEREYHIWHGIYKEKDMVLCLCFITIK